MLFRSVKQCGEDKRSILFPDKSVADKYLKKIGSQPNKKIGALTQDQKNQLNALIGKYQIKFEDSVNNHYDLKCRYMTGMINDEMKKLILMSCRLYVASNVYTASYLRAKGFNDEYKTNFSFCWDICGRELHSKKFKAMLNKGKQSELDIILDTERIYL